LEPAYVTGGVILCNEMFSRYIIKKLRYRQEVLVQRTDALEAGLNIESTWITMEL
jgi:hypothetical protein